MREVSCPRSKWLLKYAKMWTSSLYVGSRTSGSEYDDWCAAKHTQLPTAAGPAHVHRPPVPGTCMSGSNCPVTTRGTAYLMYLQSAQDRAFVPRPTIHDRELHHSSAWLPLKRTGSNLRDPSTRGALSSVACALCLGKLLGGQCPIFWSGHTACGAVIK